MSSVLLEDKNVAGWRAVDLSVSPQTREPGYHTEASGVDDQDITDARLTFASP